MHPTLLFIHLPIRFNSLYSKWTRILYQIADFSPSYGVGYTAWGLQQWCTSGGDLAQKYECIVAVISLTQTCSNESSTEHFLMLYSTNSVH